MTDEEIIHKAQEELQVPTLAGTKQYLEVLDFVQVGGKPKVERLDKESEDVDAIVYVPVKGEKFYLAVYLKTKPLLEVIGVNTTPGHNVFLRATSETMDVSQISALTKLHPTDTWGKGEPRRHTLGQYTFSMIEFRPNPEPDEFEDKLNKLLDFLERDRAGVQKLVNLASGHIQVGTHFYYLNGCIGGLHMDKDSVKRLADLNLEIDFDLYVGGNPIRD